MSTTLEQYRDMIDRQPVLPSPMCGISDLPFRSMCRELGGPLAYTQMVAAEGVSRDDRKTLGILDLADDEPPVAMQLFGCHPQKLADSARRLQDLGAAVVDLNMGCPARKVTGSMGGSALLRHPDLVREILRAMRSALTIPFTAKMRWDWDEEETENGAALEVGRIAEEEGLDGLCLHARTREQGYSGQADWDKIRRLKESVSIPVLGNGDVRAPEDAVRMMRETGCDGVMIGRAAIGGPWLIGQALARVREELGRGEGPSVEALSVALDWETRREVMLRHARLMLDRRGPRGLVEFRKHAAAYLRGVPGGKKMRVALMKVSTMEELEAVLRSPLAAEEEAGEELLSTRQD